MSILMMPQSQLIIYYILLVINAQVTKLSELGKWRPQAHLKNAGICGFLSLCRPLYLLLHAKEMAQREICPNAPHFLHSTIHLRSTSSSFLDNNV